MPKWLARVVSRPELVAVTALSALTRFWHLFSPRAVVFDEFHYERFASAYLTGRFYFDVHPPLGSLMYAGLAALLHVPADVLARPDPAPALRILPAMFGTLVVPVVYAILRQLGSSRHVATLAALAVLFDNALLVASRLVLTDMFLIGFGLGAIVVYLQARTCAMPRRWALLTASAALAGCALSVKWTGASALGLVLGAWAVESLRRRVPPVRIVGEGAVLVGIPALVYLAAFAVHFALLPGSGPGNTFMSPRFQSQLVGSLTYDPAVRVSYLENLADVHRAMVRGNASLETVTNRAASPWYSWPIMQHPFGLWDAPHVGEIRRTIVFVGNPVVWWGALLATLVVLATFAIRPRRLRFQNAVGLEYHRSGGLRGSYVHYAAWLLLGGIAINFLPFAAIRRVMYLYHYLFALVFVVMFAAWGAGALASWNADDARWSALPRWSRAAYWVAALAILAGFLYVAPLTYGWALGRVDWATRLSVLQPF